nr:retinol dehydrogenase 12-like [Onthophagus taurus]
MGFPNEINLNPLMGVTNGNCTNQSPWFLAQIVTVEFLVLYGNLILTKIFPLIKWMVVLLIVTKVSSKLTMGVCKSNVCLIGKTVIVVGGNSGLGFQTALTIAGRGAKVIIADRVDSIETRKRIIHETNNTNIFYRHLDLASLQSIRDFASIINEEEERLDILIHNAGAGGVNERYTKDGLLLQFQINHFGPFLLTHLLTKLLKKSAPSRIIFLSSVTAFFEDLTLESLNKSSKTNGIFNRFYTYGNTKLLSLIASNCFAERLKGTGVTCNAVHPGLVSNMLYRTILGPKANKVLLYFMYFILKICGKNMYEGAQTQIHCALSKELEGVSGRFLVDCKLFIQPKKARNSRFCDEIWRSSEALVKLRDVERI